MKTGSKCDFLRRVAEALQSDETIPQSSPVMFVTNTEDCRSRGYHWISIAFSIDDDDTANAMEA
jgi:hypothetical protein